MSLRLPLAFWLILFTYGCVHAQDDLPFRLERIDQTPGQSGGESFTQVPTRDGTLFFNNTFQESHLYLFAGEVVTEIDFGPYLGLYHLNQGETGHFIAARSHRSEDADLFFLPFGSSTPILIEEAVIRYATPISSYFVGDRLVITKRSAEDGNYFIVVGAEPGSVRTLPVAGTQPFGYDPVAFGDLLVISTTEGLYLTDGTPEGTTQVSTSGINSQTIPVEYNDQLFFTTGENIFVIDAGETTARQLTGAGFPAELMPTELGHLSITDNGVVYEAKTALHGAELFVTDGTVQGTRLLREFAPGPDDGIFFDPNGYSSRQLHNGRIKVFIARESEELSQVWQTDGSDAGTVLITEDDDSNGFRISVRLKSRANTGDVYFTVTDSNNGKALYHYRATDATVEAVVDDGLNVAYFMAPIDGAPGKYFVKYLGSTGPVTTFVFDPTTRERHPLPESSAIFTSGGGGAFHEGVYYFLASSEAYGSEPAVYVEGADSLSVLADVYTGRSSQRHKVFLSNSKPYYFLFSPESGYGIYGANEALDDVRYVTDVHGRLGTSLARQISSGGGEVLLTATNRRYSWLNREDNSINSFEQAFNFFGSLVFGPSIGDKFLLRTSGLHVTSRHGQLSVDRFTQNESTPVAWMGKFLTVSTSIGTPPRSRWELVAVDPQTGGSEALRTAASVRYGQSDCRTCSYPESIPITALASDGNTALFAFPDGSDELNLYRLDSTGVSGYVLGLDDGVLVNAVQDPDGSLAVLQVEGPDDGFLLAYDLVTDHYDVYRDLEQGEDILAVWALAEDVLTMTSQRLSRSVSREELIEDDSKVLLDAAQGADLRAFTDLEDVGKLFVHSGPVASELWVTDGTSAGTRKLQDIGGRVINEAAKPLPVIPGWVSFTVVKPTGGQFLYVYNFLRDELYEVPGPSELGGFASPAVGVDGRFYFSMIDDFHGQELHYLNFDFGRSGPGTIFADQNLNGVQDNDERGIANYPVTIDQLGPVYTTFTDSLGRYTIANFSADTARVSVVQTEGCYASANGSSVLVDPATADRAPDIGLASTGLGNSTTLHLTSAPVRCNFPVSFWATVINSGCTDLADLTVALRLDEEVTYNRASREPDAISADGLEWEAISLAPGQTWQTRINLTMPPEERAGTTVPFELRTMTLENGVRVLVDSLRYDPSLRCAIDPNDKLVQPARPEPSMSNYTQFDEVLTYTIRFQNTGNDTALNVRLEDQLGPGIVVSSFKPLAASHDYRVELSERGLLEVFFDNIYLPDSSANQAASNGFFAFTVRMTDEAIGRAVANTAGIYFDFNAPVITNTVRSSIVEFLDQDGDNFFFFEECDDTNPALNPDAVDVAGNGIDENCDGVDGTNRVRELLEGRLSVYPNPTSGALQVDYSRNDLLKIEVFDGLGRRVLSRDVRHSGQVSLARFPAAVYHLRATSIGTGRFVTTRIVLQR